MCVRLEVLLAWDGCTARLSGTTVQGAALSYPSPRTDSMRQKVVVPPAPFPFPTVGCTNLRRSNASTPCKQMARSVCACSCCVVCLGLWLMAVLQLWLMEVLTPRASADAGADGECESFGEW